MKKCVLWRCMTHLKTEAFWYRDSQNQPCNDMLLFTVPSAQPWTVNKTNVEMSRLYASWLSGSFFLPPVSFSFPPVSFSLSHWPVFSLCLSLFPPIFYLFFSSSPCSSYFYSSPSRFTSCLLALHSVCRTGKNKTYRTKGLGSSCTIPMIFIHDCRHMTALSYISKSSSSFARCVPCLWDCCEYCVCLMISSSRLSPLSFLWCPPERERGERGEGRERERKEISLPPPLSALLKVHNGPLCVSWILHFLSSSKAHMSPISLLKIPAD